MKSGLTRERMADVVKLLKAGKIPQVIHAEMLRWQHDLGISVVIRPFKNAMFVPTSSRFFLIESFAFSHYSEKYVPAYHHWMGFKKRWWWPQAKTEEEIEWRLERARRGIGHSRCWGDNAREIGQYLNSGDILAAVAFTVAFVEHDLARCGALIVIETSGAGGAAAANSGAGGAGGSSSSAGGT